MRWSHWQGDIIRVRQARTGALLDIASHYQLKAHLARIQTGANLKGTICVSVRKQPFNANNLGSAIYRAVQSIPDMPKNRSLHVLRYAAGSTMEEAGCSVAEIEAVLGHRKFRMALKYATQRLRAKAAISKIEAAD